jgi:uncharacterized membrane protein YbhN (UPF0104 family)
VKAARLLAWWPHAVVLGFALWCFSVLHADLTKLSLAPVLRAWNLVLVAALLSVLNYLLRIIRWRSYLKQLGHALSFRFTALTYTAGFAFTLSPGKVGELVRARYYQGHGVPTGQIAAAFFVERLMDLLAVVVLAAFITASAPRYQPSIWGAVAAIGAALCLLAVLPWDRLAAGGDSPARPQGLPRRIVAAIAPSLVAARRLLRPDTLCTGFVLGLLAWGLEGLGLSFLTSMFPGSQLALGTAIGIYAIAVLAGAVSMLPGGLGSTETVMAALLAAQGFALTEAVVVTLACRLVTLWLAVGLGWVAVGVLRHRQRALVPSWR